MVKKITTISLRIMSIGAFFLINYYVAKNLSLYSAGQFLLVFNFIYLMNIVSRYGSDTFMVKLISRNTSSQYLVKLSSNVFFLFVLFSLATTIALGLLYEIITSYIGLSSLRTSYFQSILIIPFASCCFYASFYFQAVNSFKKSLIFFNLLPYSIFLFLIQFSLSTFEVYIELLLLSYILSGSSAFILLYMYKVVSIKEFKFRLLKKLVIIGFPFFIYTISSQFILWGGQVIASPFLSEPDIAGYTISQRVTQLVSLVLIFSNFFLSPRFGKLFKEREISKIQDICSYSFKLFFIYAIFILLIFIFLHDYILAIFGSSYLEYSSILFILLIGQLVNLLTGSTGYLMAMSGNQPTLTKITGINSLVYLISVPLVTKYFSITGLAFLTSSFIAIQNIIICYVLYKKTSIRTFSLKL